MSISSNSSAPSAVTHHTGFNLYADQGGEVFGTMLALIVLASTFVVLRLISRYLARAGFWWDDVLITVALLLSIAPCVCNIVAVKKLGFGKHIYVFAQENVMGVISGYFHILYFFQIFFVLATGATKLAVLAFYRRIFPIPQFKLVLIIVSSLVAMYTVGLTALAIFQCHPIRSFWQPNEPELQTGHCLNGLRDLYVSGIINTILDFMVVSLPVPLLWRLRTSTRQKLVLTGIFFTAGFVCIISIIRLVGYSRADPKDVTWDFVGVATWSAVEPIVGILGACLPSLRPLISLIFNHNAYRSTTFQSSISSSVVNSYQPKNPHKAAITFARLEEQDGNPNTHQLAWRDQCGVVYHDHLGGPETTVYGGRGIRGQGDVIEMEPTSDVEPPRGVIRVKTEISLSSTKRLDYHDRLY